VRAAILVITVATAGVAHAEFHPPIAVKSVTAPGNSSKTLWKLVAGGSGEYWCQNAVSPTEKLTITFAGKPALDEVVLEVDASIASAEAVADDGTSFAGTRTGTTISIPLKGHAFGKLALGVTGSGHGCVNRVALGGGSTVYTTTDVSTLWADVAAAKDALVACDKKQINATFAFPFTVTWPDMDQNGMKWPHTKYTGADKLAAGCQNVHIHGAILKLEKEPKLSSDSAAAIEVDDGDMRWELTYQGKHWRVKAFAFPGA